MMGTAKHIGRIGALAVALGIGNVSAHRHARDGVDRRRRPGGDGHGCAGAGLDGVAGGETVGRLDRLDPGRDQPARRPTTPTSRPSRTSSSRRPIRADINYVAVTTPEEFWPITGLLRLIGVALGGPAHLAGLVAAAWPDEPWWKLSGLFDLTADQSVQAGVADLEDAMAEHRNDHLVIYGYSQGAAIANRGEAKARRAVPGGNHSPRYRLRVGR